MGFLWGGDISKWLLLFQELSYSIFLNLSQLFKWEYLIEMVQYMKFVRCDYIDFALVLQRHIVVRNLVDMQVEDDVQFSDWHEQTAWLIYDNQLRHLQSIHISQATSYQFLYQPDTLALVSDDQRTARLYRQQEGGLVLLDTILTLPQQYCLIHPLPNLEFLVIGRDTLQLLDSRMQMRCRVHSSCNPSETRVFSLKDNTFLLTTPQQEESWTAIYSASNLQLLQVLPSFNTIAYLWRGFTLFEREGTIRVYNISTNRTIAVLEVNQPDLEFGISVAKHPDQEFAMIDRSRVMVYSEISDEPKYNINTNDENLTYIYYWEDNSKIVVCSSDIVYIIDLKQEEERRLLNGEVPAFAAM